MKFVFRNNPLDLLLESAEFVANGFNSSARCEIYISASDDFKDLDGPAYTMFPENNGIPEIHLSCDHSYMELLESIGHELAHVIVGVHEGHSELWQLVFDEIYKEYCKMVESNPKG